MEVTSSSLCGQMELDALTVLTTLCRARGSRGRTPELPVATDGPSSEGLLGEHAMSQLKRSLKPQQNSPFPAPTLATLQRKCFTVFQRLLLLSHCIMLDDP